MLLEKYIERQMLQKYIGPISGRLQIDVFTCFNLEKVCLHKTWLIDKVNRNL